MGYLQKKSVIFYQVEKQRWKFRVPNFVTLEEKVKKLEKATV